MSDELKKVYPGEEVELGNGEKVTVSPVPFGKLMVFGEAVASLMGKIASSPLLVNNAKEGDWSSFDVGLIFTTALEEVIELMGVILEKERAWFDTISTADGIKLFDVILRQNMSEETKKNIQAIAQTIKSQFALTS